eukprot:366243-Chlamydomonas_euryale.AAC.11
MDRDGGLHARRVPAWPHQGGVAQNGGAATERSRRGFSARPKGHMRLKPQRIQCMSKGAHATEAAILPAEDTCD